MVRPQHIALFEDQAQAGDQGQLKATLSCQSITLAAKDGKKVAPEWIPLLPPGDVVVARDGRSFVNDHAAAIQAFRIGGMPIPLDWDHALDSWSSGPGDGAAAAWIDQLEVREGGGLWGHIETWTARGRASVESLEYRFISPVIFHDDQMKVISVPRASLVNNPALRLPALLKEQNRMNPQLLKLLQGLGLGETFEEKDIESVLEMFNRAKAPAIDLSGYIPRDQYEAIVAELASVKETLSAHQKAQHEARVESVIKAALESGRLLPAERQFFTEQAKSDLVKVEAFLSTRPVLLGGNHATLSAQPNPADPASLTEAEKEVARKAGISFDKFAQAKAKRNAQAQK